MSANGDSENDGENDSFIENNIYCTQNAEEVELKFMKKLKINLVTMIRKISYQILSKDTWKTPSN